MIAIYKCFDSNGEMYDGGVVYSYDMLFNRTFSPNSEYIVLGRGVHGKTYTNKKAHLRELAVYYSYMMDVPMSWSEVAEIGAWFEKYGRRYGLLREFRKNGIC